MSGSTAKNFHKNGSELVIGGVLNVVGDSEIQKYGVPVDIGGGGGSDVTWDTLPGKPSTFPPASHTHTIEDIQNLQTTLDDILARLAALEGNG